jgi:protein gp37
MALRLRGRCGYPQENPFQVTFHPDKLDEPKGWKKPARIFVCSMGDLFHDDVPFAWVVRVIRVIAGNPRHRFLILTKRPGRMMQFFRERWRPDIYEEFTRGGQHHSRPNLYLRHKGCRECRYHFLGCLNGRTEWKDKAVTPNFRSSGHNDFFGCPDCLCDAFEWGLHSEDHGVAVEMDTGEISVRNEDCIGGFPGPLKNLWLGCTVETQAAWHERRDDFLGIGLIQPGIHLFLSCEPLLDRLDLDLSGIAEGISWVIVGGETGPRARPMQLHWAAGIRDYCQSANIPFFYKGAGTATMPKSDSGYHKLYFRHWTSGRDPKSEYHELPEDLIL